MTTRTPTELLRAFVADIEALHVEGSTCSFGPFEDYTEEHNGIVVEWPNLAILVNQAKTLSAHAPAPTTHSIVCAGMCVWEWCLEHHQDSTRTDSAWWRWHNYRADHGACDTRDLAAKIGEWLQQEWEFNNHAERYGEPFDWEFVPAVMERLAVPPNEITHEMVIAACRAVVDAKAKGES